MLLLLVVYADGLEVWSTGVMQVFAGAVAKLLRGPKHALMQAKGLASHYIMLNSKYTSSALLTGRATTSDVSGVIAT
jgi:hypothetical protein